MAYNKKELIECLTAILGADNLGSLGVIAAVNEAAIQLFLNDEAHVDAVRLIKEALSDLRDFGLFKYVKNTPSEKLEYNEPYCMTCGNDDSIKMIFQSHTASGTEYKCKDCGESITYRSKSEFG